MSMTFRNLMMFRRFGDLTPFTVKIKNPSDIKVWKTYTEVFDDDYSQK
jgi:hypothetical protein